MEVKINLHFRLKAKIVFKIFHRIIHGFLLKYGRVVVNKHALRLSLFYFKDFVKLNFGYIYYLV